MAGELVPVVMIPRFSTYSSGATFATVAMDVTQYQSAILNVWRTDMSAFGTTPGFKIHFEESTDQTTWATCGGTSSSGEDPGALTEAQYVATLKRRWFRVRVVLTGSAPVVTAWCVGFLEERER